MEIQSSRLVCLELRALRPASLGSGIQGLGLGHGSLCYRPYSLHDPTLSYCFVEVSTYVDKGPRERAPESTKLSSSGFIQHVTTKSTGLLSNQGQKSINVYFIMVPLR